MSNFFDILKIPERVIPYKTLVIGVPVILALTLLCWGIFHFTEVDYGLSDLVAIFSALLVSLSLVYHGMGVRLNYNMYVEKRDADAKATQANLKIQRELASQQAAVQRDALMTDLVTIYITSLAEDRTVARRFWDKHQSLWQSGNNGEMLYNLIEGDLNKLTDDEDKRDQFLVNKAVISVMNFLENVAEMVIEKSLDEEKARNRFRAVFVSYLKRTSSYLVYRRNIDESNKDVFNKFPKLAQKWRDNEYYHSKRKTK